MLRKSMNYALIFASGTGNRMHASIPKQFIVINDKPIIVHTVDVFNESPIIDKIVIVTIDEYINRVNGYIKQYHLDKVIDVIPGGTTAMESQRNGVEYIRSIANDNDVIFIHDGVRPFIDNELLEKCLDKVSECGMAITISPASETVAILNDKLNIGDILPRQDCVLARAPQVFYVKDIYNAHMRAKEEEKSYIDSASMMKDQGYQLAVVEGPIENIKITTPYDLKLCELLMKEKKDEQ